MNQLDWMQEAKNAISQIAEQLTYGRIGFLFGAGMSTPSGGIEGNELAFQLVREALYKHMHDPLDPDFTDQLNKVVSKYPLEAIAEGVVPNFPFHEVSLVDLLKRQVFGGQEPKQHDGHKYLAMMVKRFNINMLFTTNWDALLSESIGESAEIVTNENKKFLDLDRIVRQKISVIHLHGTFDDHPLIRENDLMDSGRPLFQLFLAELITKSFVFVGYSMHDPVIRALYFRAGAVLAKRSEELRKQTYVVFPYDNDVDRRVSATTWQGRGATYIPLDAEDFFKRLYEEAVTHSMDELKKRLENRLNVTSQELQTKIDEILAVFPDFSTREQVLLYIDAVTQGGRK